jgi:hypothetical protein
LGYSFLLQKGSTTAALRDAMSHCEDQFPLCIAKSGSLTLVVTTCDGADQTIEAHVLHRAESGQQLNVCRHCLATKTQHGRCHS